MSERTTREVAEGLAGLHAHDCEPVICPRFDAQALAIEAALAEAADKREDEVRAIFAGEYARGLAEGEAKGAWKRVAHEQAEAWQRKIEEQAAEIERLKAENGRLVSAASTLLAGKDNLRARAEAAEAKVAELEKEAEKLAQIIEAEFERGRREGECGVCSYGVPGPCACPTPTKPEPLPSDLCGRCKGLRCDHNENIEFFGHEFHAFEEPSR